MKTVQIKTTIRLNDEGKILPEDLEMLKLNLATIEAVAQSKAETVEGLIFTDSPQPCDMKRLMN